jgi:hypothetical protein
MQGSQPLVSDVQSTEYCVLHELTPATPSLSANLDQMKCESFRPAKAASFRPHSCWPFRVLAKASYHSVLALSTHNPIQLAGFSLLAYPGLATI